MTEAERIDFLINVLENGNAAEFGRKIGVSRPNANKMRAGAIGYRLHINSIIAAYPAVNRAWLESGEGHPGDLSVDLVKAHYESKLRRADTIIDHLTRRIDELEKRLKTE